MKKSLLTMVTCISMSLVYAQNTTDSSRTSPLKPSRANWSTEFNINPFSGTLNNVINQIKFRSFISDQTALRLGLNFNTIKSVREDSNPYGTNPLINEVEKTSTTYGMSIGLEKHFRGTKRLSPYWGADLTFANKSSKQVTTTATSKTTIKNAWSNSILIYNGSGYQYITQQPEELGYLKYGLNLVSGFDYYISEHFFLGAEFSLGLSQINYKDVEYTQTSTQSGNTPNNSTSEQKNTSLQFGTSAYNGIRLGYIF